jgi:hypothetical protein
MTTSGNKYCNWFKYFISKLEVFYGKNKAGSGIWINLQELLTTKCIHFTMKNKIKGAGQTDRLPFNSNQHLSSSQYRYQIIDFIFIFYSNLY